MGPHAASSLRVSERLFACVQPVRSARGCIRHARSAVGNPCPRRLRWAVVGVAVVTGPRLVRDGGRWRLPLVGCSVGQCCVDWAVTLRFGQADAAFELRIEQPFVLVLPGGAEVLLDPENDPVGLGPVLACTRTAVTEAVAYDDGSIELSFVDGSSVRVPGSPEYEAWGLVGPAGLRVVSLPGGELTVWQPEGNGRPAGSAGFRGD